MDITYISMARGFVYLAVVLDPRCQAETPPIVLSRFPRAMKRMGIEALYRRPRTTKPERPHCTTADAIAHGPISIRKIYLGNGAFIISNTTILWYKNACAVGLRS